MSADAVAPTPLGELAIQQPALLTASTSPAPHSASPARIAAATVAAPSFVEGAPPDDVVVRMRNVHKTYLLGVEGVPALRGVSVDIREGEFVVILGKSGGGKTTMLNVLGTVDRPTRGDLYLTGTRVDSKTSDAELARLRLLSLGFVFQTFNLLPSLTAVENVELPMVLAGWGSPAKRRARATKLLARVGMAERLTHTPAQMSGGEQQRVTIARALANRPRILLLDEPTGDLDTVNTSIVLSILTRLNEKHGVTCIMVTHDVSLKAYAHRVLHMLDGKIARVEDIPPYVREHALRTLQGSGPVQAMRQALAADRRRRMADRAAGRGGGGGSASDGSGSSSDEEARIDVGSAPQSPAARAGSSNVNSRAARQAARARARQAMGLPPEATQHTSPLSMVIPPWMARGAGGAGRFAAEPQSIAASSSSSSTAIAGLRLRLPPTTAAEPEQVHVAVGETAAAAAAAVGGSSSSGSSLGSPAVAPLELTSSSSVPVADMPAKQALAEGVAGAGGGAAGPAFGPATSPPLPVSGFSSTSTGLSGVAAIAHSVFAGPAGTSTAAGGAGAAGAARGAAGGTGGMRTVVRSPASYATHTFAERARAHAAADAVLQAAAEATRQAAAQARYAALLADQQAALAGSLSADL